MGVIGAMILVLASPVAGQTPRRGVEVQAYAFGGGGKTTGATYNSEVGATATAGGGLQFLFESGIALSGELEVMDRRSSYGSSFHPSVNLGYHFGGKEPDRRVVPFLSGGYTANVFGVNVGGGIQYWAWKRVGIRTEVREHAFLYGGRYDVYEFRLGLAFR